MCGISGVWNFSSPRETVQYMVRALRHRGPEAEGLAVDDRWGLGHARLAIIDLTGGDQPIWDARNEVVIIGNNEIYNAPALRKELESKGHRFKTHSDTEVALQGYLAWGADVFRRLNGMFAFIIIDTVKKRCLVARDPMGIKPLHYARIGNAWAFASEVKALLTIDGIKKAPDWDAVHLFMNLRFIPGERTLFKGIERLEPGSFLVLSETGVIQKERYFDLRKIELNPDIKYADACERLQTLLDESVERHLLSDVEVASYLSGGVDSSLVTAIAASKNRGLRSFCMAFGEPTDENSDARKVANLIGTNHTDLHVGASPLDRFSEIIGYVEEPKVNCVQGFLLAEKVSKEVKVALSGLGGDELFAGYVNNDILYPMTLVSSLFKSRRKHSLSGLQSALRSSRLDFYLRGTELLTNIANPLSFYIILRNGFDHNRALMSRMYSNAPSHWHGLTEEVLKPYFNPSSPDILNEILKLEAQTKLTNDFLFTEDRVSMAHSLEVRVPFLDKELVEFAFSLPSNFKYGPRNKKKILKDAALKWLPRDILEKKKWGFSFNPYHLFQKQLRTTAMSVLTEKRVKDLGVFSWKWIDDVLTQRPTPRMRWHYFNLWVMLGIFLWHERFFGDGTLGKSD